MSAMRGGVFLTAAAGLLSMACAGPVAEVAAPAPAGSPVSIPAASLAPDRTHAIVSGAARREPVVPPQIALLVGLMPLHSTGVDALRASEASADGRGVLIAILDGGVDPGLPGMQRTTTGERKIVDVRDFSGEGRVQLVPARLDGGKGVLEFAGRRVGGAGRIAALASPPYYGGVFREMTLGAAPAGDLDGDGGIGGEFAVAVARASDAWIAVIDSDGDGRVDDERPIRDYQMAADTFTFRGDSGTTGGLTVAVNLAEANGRPTLDLVFDNSSHGSHVAGIAAGHDLFGLDGFDGVAPGAQVLALKIANNTRGGISVSGSMVAALQHAADVARRRNQPLVVNLSYGVGNEVEGTATIDSLLDAFAREHLDVLVVVSAGNDGPGISTVDLPGSADQVLTVCALFPGVFVEPPRPGAPPAPDLLGWWSARGGETAKPDLCAPGVAYSNVPRWGTGEELSGGTSMAAPHVAGAAALLQSAMLQSGAPVRAVDLKRALMVTATPLGATTVLDEGAGVADLPRALQWLRASHQAGAYRVRAVSADGTVSTSSAALRRNGLASAADTLQAFLVTSVGGQAAARLVLESDVPWLRAPPVLEPGGSPATVQVTYDGSQLTEPGLYVGTVWARPGTDSLAGPAFGLTNTVVVPRSLASPFRVRGMVTPGAVARHFVDVPAGSGGLTVRLDIPDPAEAATLYLFEPSGQPYRGGSSAAAAGGGERGAQIVVAADDLRPGVYEVVVVAPPMRAATYGLMVAEPAVAVTALEPGPGARLFNHEGFAIPVRVDARLLGAARVDTVRGADGGAALLRTEVPRWAGAMVIDVELSTGLWRELTDCGVTVFDTLGKKIADGPLKYASGRQTVALDSILRGVPLVIELAPAFARVAGVRPWAGVVHVSYLLEQAVSLEPIDAATYEVPANGEISVGFRSGEVAVPAPDGYLPLVEVTARGGAGVAAVRRGVLEAGR